MVTDECEGKHAGRDKGIANVPSGPRVLSSPRFRAFSKRRCGPPTIMGTSKAPLLAQTAREKWGTRHPAQDLDWLVLVWVGPLGNEAQLLIDVGPVLSQEIACEPPANIAGIADEGVTDATAAFRVVRVRQGFCRKWTEQAPKVDNRLAKITARFN